MHESLSTTHHDSGGAKNGLKNTGWFPDENDASHRTADMEPEKTQTITTCYFSAKLYVPQARIISSEVSHEEGV